MMEDDFFNEREEEREIVDRFDKMIQGGMSYFFDSEEFEIIIDYYLDQMNMERAFSAIKMALRQYPQSTCFKLKHARYLFLAGKVSLSYNLLQEVLAIEPDNLEACMLYGQLLSQRNESKKAIEQFKKVVEEDEYEEAASLSIAMEYECLGHYSQAIQWMKRAIYLNPGNDRLISDISFCYEISGQHAEAITFFEIFLDQYPFSEMAWLNLGVSYFNMELYEKAIDAYDFAIAIDDDFSVAHFNKGNALTHLERYDEAIEAYNEMIRLERNDPLVYYYLGECYLEKEEYIIALKYYKKSLELDGRNPEVYVGIAICLSESRHESLALNFIEKALKLSVNNTDYLRMKADILLKLDLFEKACEVYKKITLYDRNNTEVWLDYSHAWMEHGDMENGLDILRSGILQHPENAELKFRMAACLVKAGKIKEAGQFFEKALRINPSGYEAAFDYYPSMKDIPPFLDLIES